jgi:hypothetical protein
MRVVGGRADAGCRSSRRCGLSVVAADAMWGFCVARASAPKKSLLFHCLASSRLGVSTFWQPSWPREVAMRSDRRSRRTVWRYANVERAFRTVNPEANH